MKGIDIFCASQAATAIRLSMDEGSSSSSSSSTTHLGGGRAIDRHNPIITDSSRIGKSLPPSSSQPPIAPKSQKRHHKIPKISSKLNDDKAKKNCSKPDGQERKSCGEASDGGQRKSWSCTKPGDFISPPSSSRYLLNDRDFLDVLSDLALVPLEPCKSQATKTEESPAPKPPLLSRSPDKVVVLRVSLHCKGCERKMRKHISRMEGVTSFNIDFAAKKVTVIGDVTPSGVLASVSKVKNAQLWTPAISSSTPSIPSVIGSSYPEVKKYTGVTV